MDEMDLAFEQHFRPMGLDAFMMPENIQHASEVGMNFLAHYGVKGMKWGVRRRGGVTVSKTDTRSADSHEVKSHRETIKKGGVKSLSNAELKKTVERMNLEQQYSNLKSREPNKIKNGHTAVKSVLAIGATVNTAIAFANSPAGQLIKAKLK